MLLVLQMVLSIWILLDRVDAKPPPGYEKPPELADKNPPKYEYGYSIADLQEGTGQGKLERRNGELALGRYFVQGDTSSQNVEYFADDWGFHPLVEYSNNGPHSQSTTHFALGQEAVNALRNSNKTLSPSLRITESIENRIFEQNDQANENRITVQTQALIQSQAQHEAQANEIATESQPDYFTAYQNEDYYEENRKDNDGRGEENREQNEYKQNEHRQDENKNQIDQNGQTFNEETQSQQFEDSVFNNKESADGVAGENTSEHVNNQNSETRQNDDTGQNHESTQNEETIPHDYTKQYDDTRQNEIKEHQTTEASADQQPTENYYREENNQEENKISNSESEETNDNSSHDDYYEAAALYENNEKILMNEQQNQQHNEASLNFRYLGDFGAKINPKQIPNPNSISEGQSRLIENTKHLISGQDVLNINEAIGESTTEMPLTENANKSVSDSVISLQQYIASTYPSFIITDRSSNEESEHVSLSKQPIVVADDYETDEHVQAGSENFEHTRERDEVSSTTINAVENSNSDNTESDTVLVTPKPLSNDFLAPINAGVRLENQQQNEDQPQKHEHNQNFFVEVQQSVPYYLGKFEYPTNLNGGVDVQQSDSGDYKIESAVQNIELGKTLINFPVSGFSEEIQHNQLQSLFSVQQLPSPANNQQFKERDQVQQSDEHVDVSADVPNYEAQASVSEPLVQAQVVEKEITKVINNPYPVEVPYPVDRPYPVPVEKVVEKPVHHVVEKPVPVEVTKYIDRPYPVKVPEPVPYPVESIVERVVKQPYPVEVKVPVEVPVKVPVPVEKIVEKQIPVPHYIDRPVPVEKIVEKQVPQYIEKPYPVEVKVPVPVPQAYYVPVEVPKPYPVEVTKYVAKPYPVPQPYPVKVTETVGVPVAQPVPYEVRVPHPVPVEVPKYIEKIVDRPYPVYITKGQKHQKHFQSYYYAPGYLPPKNCDQTKSHSNFYLGMVPPPKSSEHNRPSPQQHHNHNQQPKQHHTRVFRNPRSNFNSQSIRLEYGFMPPLIPSLEIDEYGNPINKDE